MILESGVELGEYEILGLVGEGAMGKVYRARDRTLGREVALKVLSVEFSAKDEHVARFQREARVLASLNHPNIATIHGVRKVGEASFLILELIEGETLTELIARGRVPLRRALEILLQVANALEAAHARGVVHRDLKPGNVKVTEGKVKVLDFGIAKFFDDETDESSTDEVAEVDDLTTETGVVLGTVGYMSPEQVRGNSIDGRSDIWAFGCLLFELLTGKRAFRGRTPTDTLVQVLDREPNWKALPPDVPPSIERLLQRCFRKDRNQRLQAIGDARIEIEDVLLDRSPIASADASSARGIRRKLAFAALVTGVVTGYAASRAISPSAGIDPSRPSGGGVLRFSFALGEDERLPYLGQRSLAASPDGSRFAFVVEGPDGSTRIRERALDRLESSSVPDTTGAREPFYSPDAKWLGFFALSGDAHRLQRLSFEGGVPVVFHEELQPPRGGVSWSEGDEIAFASADGLRVISSNGGAPRVVACGDDSSSEVCRWPEILPGGKALIYTMSPPSSAETRVVATSLLSGERRTLVEGGSAARYSKTGHLVYAQRGGLFAASFDVETLELTSEATRLASDVLTDAGTGAAQFAISNEGTLVFAAGKPLDPGSSLLWLDPNGRRYWTSAERFRLRGPFRLSPDGGMVALAIDEPGKADIWLYDLKTHALRLFTHGGSDDSPVWSPDGTRLAFRSLRSGKPQLFSKEVTGEAPEISLLDRDDLEGPASWETGSIAFTVRTLAGLDVWSLDPEAGEANPLLTSKANESEPTYSAGRLAYVSDATGRAEVYVLLPGAQGGPLRISNDGGRAPRWSRDGKTLFYRGGKDLFSAAVGSDESIPAPPALVWSMAADGPYEILPDGGFLVAEEPAAPRDIVVVSNFTAELPRH
jgi:eukaryotic-like serine/threonine-protein kinase